MRVALNVSLVGEKTSFNGFYSRDARAQEDKPAEKFAAEILIIQMEGKQINKRMILEIMITWILMRYSCIHTIHQKMRGKVEIMV